MRYRANKIAKGEHEGYVIELPLWAHHNAVSELKLLTAIYYVLQDGGVIEATPKGQEATTARFPGKSSQIKEG